MSATYHRKNRIQGSGQQDAWKKITGLRNHAILKAPRRYLVSAVPLQGRTRSHEPGVHAKNREIRGLQSLNKMHRHHRQPRRLLWTPERYCQSSSPLCLIVVRHERHEAMPQELNHHLCKGSSRASGQLKQVFGYWRLREARACVSVSDPRKASTSTPASM